MMACNYCYLPNMILAELVEMEVNPLNKLRIKKGWHSRTTANYLYENVLRTKSYRQLCKIAENCTFLLG